MNPLTAHDFYKADHKSQYPEGTEYVYSNFTARSARLFKDHKFDNKVVFFGLQYFIKSFIIDEWQREFFTKDKDEVVYQYKRRLDNALGKDKVDVKHIEDLHDVGYLPIIIKALPEGSRVNIGVPLFTVINSNAKFFWLTNFIETVMSAYMWKPITIATIANEYRKIVEHHAQKTCDNNDHVDFQVHDFSFRGMSGLEDAALSGAAHLLSFAGTDTVPAIDLLEEYYGSRSLIGCSVPATEHSVMCMGTKEAEIDTFKRLIADIYPEGIVSIVSDTWDLWKVITSYLPKLKSIIMQRNGKVVIRPDSGDPLDIICGSTRHHSGKLRDKSSPEYKGVIQCLWEIFGGTTNSKGYKVLDPHIGVIYGDSITRNYADFILRDLEKKGFASSNIVFGVGSYSYQYVTRDTFGFAMKATWGVVNGEEREIYKDPKTDCGTKKSAKGLLRVEKKGEDFILHDCQTQQEEQQGELKIVYAGGPNFISEDLDTIRSRLHQSNNKEPEDG